MTKIESYKKKISIEFLVKNVKTFDVFWKPRSSPQLYQISYMHVLYVVYVIIIKKGPIKLCSEININRK